MQVKDYSDEEVVRVRRMLKDPSVKRALIPVAQWLKLADHTAQNCREFSALLAQQKLLASMVPQSAEAVHVVSGELDKLSDVQARLSACAAQGGGTAEQYLQLMLKGYQLAQGIRQTLVLVHTAILSAD